jgi:SAM-dependent methyltransferase
MVAITEAPMTAESLRDFYNAHAAQCDPTDFWGQVKRTVNGNPVSQDQIDMIVAAVRQGLDIRDDDVLLDLCCGNGALTACFFADCRGGLGVDFSDYLIEVANRHHVRRPQEAFVVQDVVEFLRLATDTGRFTKALCYGAMQYLGKPEAAEFLALTRRRFPNITRFFIGNLPDKERLHDFFTEGRYRPGIEDEPTSAIGIWRTPDEFADLAAAAGWRAEFRRMPRDFYAAHYRYDAVLTPL